MDKRNIRVSETDLRKSIIQVSRELLVDIIGAQNKHHENVRNNQTKLVRGSFLSREEKEMRKFLYSLVDISLSNA